MRTNYIRAALMCCCLVTVAYAETPEIDKVVEVLKIKEGAVVADVGAGEGSWTVALGQRVGETGQVYSTEISNGLIARIKKKIQEAELTNVTTIKGEITDTKLPKQCCDAILLRRVYHHLTNPRDMNQSLFKSLRPGGLILVIDFEPGAIGAPTRIIPGVPKRRGGHGTPKDQLIEEMTMDGFKVVHQADSWSHQDYAILFQRPQ